MIGSSVECKACDFKSECKTLTLMSANSESLELRTTELDGSLLNGEKENNAIQGKDMRSMDGEKTDENACGPIIVNGDVNEEQVVGEGNDEERVDVNGNHGIDVNKCANVPVCGETQSFSEEVNGKDNVASTEELGTQEVLVKENETLTCGLDIKGINTVKETKGSEVASDKEVDVGVPVSKHQITDEDLTVIPQNGKEVSEINSAVPVGTSLDNQKKEYRREDASIVDNVKAAAVNVKVTKRRILNREVFEKKMVLGNNELSINQAKPLSSIGNDARDEAKEVDPNQHVNNDDKDKPKPKPKPVFELRKKLNRMRKKDVFEGRAGMTASNYEHTCGHTNRKTEITNNKVADKQNQKNDAPGKSRDWGGYLQSSKEENTEKEITIEMVAERRKSSTRFDGRGLIFMCNSETKEDCYRYKVLGLPPRKKDIVHNIYKGMRLFLFNVDWKMMHGIFRAAGPGGYNIEPRAFGSQFPYQVRFTLLEDCLPLAEETFRSAIKDNYYTKKKFNCELTSEQVRNLCKLFIETTKRVKSALALRSQIAAAPLPPQSNGKRKRFEDSISTGPIASLEWERSQGQAEDEVTLDPLFFNERYPHPSINCEHHVVYENETYLRPSTSPPLCQHVLPQSTPHTLSYFHSEAPMVDSYRRDSTVEHHEQSLYEYQHHPYASHIEVHPYGEPPHMIIVSPAYQEPAYETIVSTAYREPAYESGVCQQCHKCSHHNQQVGYYRRSECCPPLPPYRRY